MSETDDANADWRSQPDWVEHLSREVGNALAATNDSAMTPILDEIDALLDGGHETVATLVAQAALYRAVKGPVVRQDFDAAQLTEPTHLEALIADALSAADRTPELARAVAAVARVSVEQRTYQRASQLFLLAASIWADEDNAPQQALNLLRAGAAAFQLDEDEAALEISERARDIYARLGDDKGATLATLNLAQIANSAGDVDTAADLLNRARELSRGHRDGRITTSILLEDAILTAESGDTSNARNLFRVAYRSARRRGDLEQALIAAKNLAIVASEESAESREIHWWHAALALAIEVREWREQQELERALGIALMRAGKYQDAVLAFDRAIELNNEHDNAVDAARAKADKGAVLLERATKSDLNDEDFAELTTEAISVLDEARTELESLADFEWAAIAVRNLRTAWVLQNTEAVGASVLIDTAENPHLDSDYRVELRRNAAWLLLSSGSGTQDDARPVQWLVDAASTPSSTPLEAAWSLAKQAASLAQRGFNQAALSLYDAALAKISPADDASAYGNMLNDSVLVMDDEADHEEMRQRLLRVEAIARDTQDRVLLSLALLNLGQTVKQAADLESARNYYSEAVELSNDIGDDARAAEALASLSNTYVSEGQSEEAARMSQDALLLAIRSDSDEAWVSATSAVASAAYLRGEYEAAYRGWIACIERENPDEQGEHQAYALDSLAALGDWPRFRRELERFAKHSQKTNTQFVFVEKLYIPAMTWLRADRPQAAGVVIAFGVMLAFESASLAYGAQGRELSTAERERSTVRVGSAMGAARAVFELLELPDKATRVVRNAYERTIRRAAGNNAGELLQIVDRYIRDAETDEDEPTR